MLPNGTLVQKQDRYVPLRIVPIENLNQELVRAMKKKVGELKAFVTNKRYQPSEGTLSHSKNIMEEALSIKTDIRKIISEIAHEGALAIEIYDMMRLSQDLGQQFEKKWAQFAYEKKDKLRALELQNAPEKFREAFNRFRELNEIIAKNYDATVDNIQQLLKQYVGKENDHVAMLALRSQLVDIINRSEIVVSIEEMQMIFNKTLKFLPNSDLRNNIEYVLTENANIIQVTILGIKPN